MLKFPKTTVAEDATTTEEVLEILEAEEVRHQEEKETLPQDVKADLEATEVQLLEKVVLAEEANPEVHQRQEEKETLLQDVKADSEATEVQLLEKVDSEAKEVSVQEEKALLTGLQDATEVLRKDRQDVLKVLVTHQEKEDQEEAKKDCRLQILDCRFLVCNYYLLLIFL